ncbi:MAG: (2Fe-2S) ferredoxin domain-containing protein [Myxococcales bacterium]|nr:(2Fe-2S) ferredoxin domain-containing protein [Myxococcales bacterium]
MPRRERYLWVCRNQRPPDHPKGSCGAGGSHEILDALKAGVARRGLRHRVRICESGCLDLCWTGPAIAVMPDHVFYGRVRATDVPEILDALEAGRLVDRLVLPPEAFDEPARSGG